MNGGFHGKIIELNVGFPLPCLTSEGLDIRADEIPVVNFCRKCWPSGLLMEIRPNVPRSFCKPEQWLQATPFG